MPSSVSATNFPEWAAWCIGMGMWIVPIAFVGVLSAIGNHRRSVADTRSRTQGTPEHERSEALGREHEERQRKQRERRRRAQLEAARRVIREGTEPITSWQAAERAMARQMEAMDFTNVRVTARGSDEGIDIRASGAAAQVKFLSGSKVGRPAIQQLRGAAGPRTKALFFAFGPKPYTREAIAWAEEHGVALFAYGRTGITKPLNVPARDAEASRRIDTASVVATAQPIRVGDWVWEADYVVDRGGRTVVADDWHCIPHGWTRCPLCADPPSEDPY